MAARFGELDGAEFVYKESSYTRLMDVTERLKKQFAALKVELLDNSIAARERLDAERSFLQVVSVEPHLDASQRAERSTLFDKNFNLHSFYYETPFTKRPDGKAHGEIEEQWKRKTVLTTEAPFPHMRKRLRVVKSEGSDVSPIAGAIELLQRKVRVLKAELASAAPQTKQLQMQLQGSLLTAVTPGRWRLPRRS